MKRFKKRSVILLCCLLLSVIALPVSASAAKLNKKKLTLNVGQTSTLKVSGTKAKIKWTSSKKSVASVSAKGLVKAKKKGSAVITAKYGKKKLTCTVTVKQPVTSVKLNKKSATLKKGKSLTLKATVSPGSANNKSVTWSSNNKKVATVSSKGVVKAVGKGTATITVKAKDGSKKKATCKITVNAAASTNNSTVITTLEQLLDVLKSAPKGKTYTLGKNIDFNEYVPDHDDSFESYASAFSEFNGILDGKGHKLLNLKKSLVDYNYGTIKNVILDHVSGLGALAEYNYGTIKDITVNDLSGQAALVVSRNYGTVENVNFNSCNVVGLNTWIATVAHENYGTISGCTVKGKLDCPSGSVAAIAYTNIGGTIANCNNYATITAMYRCAGICIENEGQITKCVNYGSIKGDYDVSSGIADEGAGKIDNCLNVGKVDNGLICSLGSGGVIQNCVNVGESLKGTIRDSVYGNVMDCYYLSSTPEPNLEKFDGGTVRMIPVDRSDLTNKAAYPTLDFSKDWMMGAQYPVPRQ